MRAPLRWAVVVLAGLGALALSPVSVRAQEAADVAEVGWWTDNPAPNAPSGGFEVAEQPQGPLSVAAIRITVEASSLTVANLSLSQASSLGNPALQVCPTTATWTAASPGKLGEAPAPDCTAPVPLTLNADQAVWTADVLRLLTGSQVSLMIVPKPDPALPLQTPFQVEFAKAELQSDGTFAPAGAGLSDDTGSIASGDTGTGFGDVSAGAFGLDTGSLDTPALTVPSLGEQAVVAPAQVSGRFPDQSASLKHRGRSKPWGRLPLLIILAGLVGTAVSFGQIQLRQRGLLAT